MAEAATATASPQMPLVMADDAYGRLLVRLVMGEAQVLSYDGHCQDSPGESPAHTNVLHEGRIARVVGSERQPVYRFSEVVQMMAGC